MLSKFFSENDKNILVYVFTLKDNLYKEPQKIDFYFKNSIEG
jgi:hypothetical protein